jgi:hypothetical protein
VASVSRAFEALLLRDFLQCPVRGKRSLADASGCTKASACKDTNSRTLFAGFLSSSPRRP